MKKEKNIRFTPKLEKQEMSDVFIEFYRLEEIFGNKSQYARNYTVIRLVTVIEQFFRKIVEKQIRDGKEKNILQQLEFDANDFVNLPQKYKERFISSHFCFQSVRKIKNTMKKVGISDPFGDEKNSKAFEDLFRLRHDTVHTVMPLKESITKYHKMTEDVMMHMLGKTHGADGYFCLSQGNALLMLERYEDAIQSYDQLIKIKRDDHNAHINKGFSFAGLGQFDNAISCFEEALNLKPKLCYRACGQGNRTWRDRSA